MSSSPTSHSARPSTRRILCVEPHLDDRRFICGALAAPGWTIECVGTVSEALALLAHHPRECDLVVTTDDQPTTDGLALVRAARDGGYAGTILVLCADLPPVRAAFFRSSARTCVLVKPVPAAFLRAAADSSPHLAA